MSYSLAVAPAREARTRRAEMAFGWPLALAAIAFLLLWLEIIFQLQGEWSLNPQYGYGWAVPFLALWLFYQRWICRPAQAAPRYPGLTISLALVAAATLLPVRLIAVANPDWRLISWTMSVVAVVLSLCALYLTAARRGCAILPFPFSLFSSQSPGPCSSSKWWCNRSCAPTPPSPFKSSM